MFFIQFVFSIALLSNTILPSELPTEEDKMTMIPSGNFMMGKDGNENSDFYPAHQVHIDSFYLDKREITNGEYLIFCEATSHKLPEYWGMDIYKSGPDYPDHPVVGVNYMDAKKYAEWKGKRLPTEAEWEYAARAGLIDKNYPHGDEQSIELFLYNGRKDDKGPVATGSFEANSYGLFDMAGNVWEWVFDWYEYDYYKLSPTDNPTGPERGRFRVIRSGGWHSGPFCTRVYYRNGLPPNWCDFAVGFRCAKNMR